MTFPQLLHTAYELFVVIGGIGGACLALWKRRTIVIKVKEFFHGVSSLVAMRSKLEFIVSELTPNGGSSLKDTVTKIGRRVEEVEEKTSEHLQKQDEHLAQQDEHLEKQDQAIDEFGNRIDRLIVHQAKNDLHVSRLFKEAEGRLKEKGLEG